MPAFHGSMAVRREREKREQKRQSQIKRGGREGEEQEQQQQELGHVESSGSIKDTTTNARASKADTTFHLGVVFVLLGFLMVFSSMILSSQDWSRFLDHAKVLGVGTTFVLIGLLMVMGNRIIMQREEDELAKYVHTRLGRSRSGQPLNKDVESNSHPGSYTTLPSDDKVQDSRHLSTRSLPSHRRGKRHNSRLSRTLPTKTHRGHKKASAFGGEDSDSIRSGIIFSASAVEEEEEEVTDGAKSFNANSAVLRRRLQQGGGVRKVSFRRNSRSSPSSPSFRRRLSSKERAKIGLDSRGSIRGGSRASVIIHGMDSKSPASVDRQQQQKEDLPVALPINKDNDKDEDSGGKAVCGSVLKTENSLVRLNAATPLAVDDKLNSSNPER